MELTGKQKLMEKLDDCLIGHAEGLCAWGTPSIAALYHFQELAELHCYLKTAHTFTAAEVEALLRFDDPLEVAAACWEENPHEYSFPICELLEELHAYEKFPLAQADPPPEKISVRDRLRTAMQEARRSRQPRKDIHTAAKAAEHDIGSESNGSFPH